MDILAKSDGTTLIEHIEDCLVVFSQIKETLPSLPFVTGLTNFWDLLFFSIYIHDFGKSHLEFQKVLKNIVPNFWEGQRHELYSIPFVDNLDLDDKEKLLIKRVILGHHKDFLTLSRKLKSKDDLELEYECVWSKRQNYDKAYHPEDFVENVSYDLNINYLTNMINKYIEFYKKFSGQEIKEILLQKEIVFKNKPHPYSEIAKETHRKDFDLENKDYWQNLLLLGAMKICDHYGSAKIKNIYKIAQNDFSFLNRLEVKLKSEYKDYHSHQKECFKNIGNCILIAPTGSGKTEASMGWLKKQVEKIQGRTFYILPYTASINAMYKRLSADFYYGDEKLNKIGLQHGKLTQFLADYYEFASNSKTENIEKNKRIKRLRDQYKKMIYPIKIVTPFQLLKFCYGVKGFEMGFTELAGANLIFDEIHAYDEVTFAQILVSLKHLTKFLNCNVIIMTATLPSFMLNELKNTLGVNTPIKATKDFLKNYNRHSVIITNSTIFDEIEQIKDFFDKGKRIIIVCNTVQNAQTIYNKIKTTFKIDKDKLTLIHSRFNAGDRLAKEAKAHNDMTRILIGTQAIEVSLDIDYDVMFSEPAPLDALLQRFGRVNRKRLKKIAPVHVCKIGGEYDHLIYPKAVVERTMELFNKIGIIEENKIQDYLDIVYPDWEKDQKIRYEDTKTGFEQALKALQPYKSHKEKEEEFYEKFDGIQVLPAYFLAKYKSLVYNYDFIEAEKLLVTIHRGQYFHLKNNDQISQSCILFEKEIDEKFKQYVTIAKCKYNSEIGMTNEYENIKDLDDNIM